MNILQDNQSDYGQDEQIILSKIKIDNHLFKLIIFNFLSNSVKYNKYKGIIEVEFIIQNIEIGLQIIKK